MIFPTFENIDIIDTIRGKYDPVAKDVAPHITLVFPFESEIPTSILMSHVTSKLTHIKPFSLTMKEIIMDDTTGFYLFLLLQNGNDVVKKIHEKLNEDLLFSYRPNFLNTVEFNHI